MLNDYFNYFRSLAVTHPAILHNTATESLNAKASDCKFGKFWEPDVFAKTPPMGAASPDITMLLHLLEGATDDRNGLYAINGIFSGGFVISKRANKSALGDEEACYTQCFEVVLDILKELLEQTFAACHGFAMFDFSKINYYQVGPIWDNRFGWWVKFDFSRRLELLERNNVFIATETGQSFITENITLE